MVDVTKQEEYFFLQQANLKKHSRYQPRSKTSNKGSLKFKLVAILIASLSQKLLTKNDNDNFGLSAQFRIFKQVDAHIVLTRDGKSQNLVLSDEGGGKKGGGGGNVVIAGNEGAGGSHGGNSNFVMEDAADKAGDVVIYGKNLVIPGEDGHIVLSDSRQNGGDGHHDHHRGVLTNPLIFWLPYLDSRLRSTYMMSLLAGQIG